MSATLSTTAVVLHLTAALITLVALLVAAIALRAVRESASAPRAGTAVHLQHGFIEFAPDSEQIEEAQWQALRAAIRNADQRSRRALRSRLTRSEAPTPTPAGGSHV